MSESTPAVSAVGTVPTAGGDLTASMLRELKSPAPTMTAMQAAQRLCALHEMTQVLGQLIEVQAMAAAWAIRREYSGREAFERFVADFTPVRPAQAWLMAETWEVTRRNREVRKLADTRPRDALQLVRGVFEAAGEEGLEALSGGDRTAAQILAKPGKQRLADIRELIAAGRAAAEGRHPADRERIRALEAERDAAVEALHEVGAVTAHPASQLNAAATELQETEKALAELAERFQSVAGVASASTRERVLHTCALALASVERISGLLLDGDRE